MYAGDIHGFAGNTHAVWALGANHGVDSWGGGRPVEFKAGVKPQVFVSYLVFIKAL